MGDVTAVDDKNFEAEVLASTVPVLVDFGADWCGPCARQLPILEKFAAENKGKVKVVSVDIEEALTVTSKFGIKSVPSMLLFIGGQKVDSRVGLTTLVDLNSFVLTKLSA
jgi:thioredoxin 1